MDSRAVADLSLFSHCFCYHDPFSEADMATEFSNAAGGTLKQKLAGAKLQRKYFEEQLHRQDRKLAVEVRVVLCCSHYIPVSLIMSLKS